MNSNAAGTQTWWVKALGGPLNIAVFARSVNAFDPSNVNIQVFNSGGGFVGSATASYPAGQAPGSEVGAMVPSIPAGPGGIFRIVVSTPGTPPTQSHYRLRAYGADAFMTGSPSSPSFEEGPMRWRFQVMPGEPLSVRVSTQNTPAIATELTYRWIDPAGTVGPISVAMIPNWGSPQVLGVPTPAVGRWTLDILDATDHYTLEKMIGIDRGIYLDWSGSGEASASGLISLDGAPNTRPVTLEIRDALTGDLVGTAAGVTNTFGGGKLRTGDYLIKVIVPPGITPIPDLPVRLVCDEPKHIDIHLTSEASFPLSVTLSGTGVGSVSSLPAGIDCGGACSATYFKNVLVTLTATPAVGSTFTGWSGACAGTSATCAVNMDAAKTVSATFTRKKYPLTIAPFTGGGGGTVVCVDCVEVTMVEDGATITLTATPSLTSNFAGWTGACEGTSGTTCSLTVTGPISVGAIFTPKRYTLGVVLQGNGTGAVLSSPTGIDCGADCGEEYSHGTLVTLSATPASNSLFTGWSGACSGTGACTVTMDATKTAWATFTKKTHPLTIAPFTGGGEGAVVCVDCVEVTMVEDGATITLTATPSLTSEFAGWTGACEGHNGNTCTITVTGPISVGAIFTPRRYTLGVVLQGTGTGSVTSAPSGIDCGSDCGEEYNHGTVVTLTPTPAADSIFSGWTGACTGTGICTVTVDRQQTAWATFDKKRFPLTITPTIVGDAGGSIRCTDCDNDANSTVVVGATVTFTAEPTVTSVFTGWSGACEGQQGLTCTVIVNGPVFVGGSFETRRHTLSIPSIGMINLGTGSVSSAPAGIDCGFGTTAACTATYVHGTVVTLTATPASDSTFAYWGGDCAGSSPTCTVTMTSDHSVMPTFEKKKYLVTITPATGGNGSGTILCPDCSDDPVVVGTTLTFTAQPSPASVFAGWTGACEGQGPVCTITVTGPIAVGASFDERRHTLDIPSIGMINLGTGSVASAPAGISCGFGTSAACTATYVHGTVVTLTATPASDSTFAYWGGDCAGSSPTCTVTMDADHSAMPTFEKKKFVITITPSAGGGTVLCPDCNDGSVVYGTTVIFTAQASVTSAFTGWTGACAGQQGLTCSVTVTGPITVGGNFTPLRNTLEVTLASVNTGTGNVTSSPAGIDCGLSGTVCAGSFINNTAVTLTATPNTDSTFVGWTGACTGSANCIVTMDSAKSVGATFARKQSVPGRVNGQGIINGAADPVRFQFNARQELNGSLSAKLDVNVGKKQTSSFEATSLIAAWFGDSVAELNGTGRWNGQAGYTFEVRAADLGEPGKGVDTFNVVIRDGNGAVVLSSEGLLTSGNIQALLQQ